ncbi:MAG: 2-succinyl-5-enolpyruvyl-6-hydroxy-3-cyclohexene-1-carboxylic-acid synthase [Melioribacteraceae bacterium]|nr:2-succinyl-5-enolpyruvyl-6-hydroxy-3-cyclohexene-1-carboxylic-acid synthase [Melioribacteraceae bacterium]
MKIAINRNIFWSDLLLIRLQKFGIKNVTISPGSRSTSLTYSFAAQEYFKKYTFIDERSSGFFALGLAKKTRIPTVIVTTSGSATAELYPAIVEAYYQQTPLIIITTDRPQFLRNRGINQTINQSSIFNNHILAQHDIHTPQLNFNSINDFVHSIDDILLKGFILTKGPVHLNLQFDKPFEPDSTTDRIAPEFLDKAFGIALKDLNASEQKKTIIDSEILKIINSTSNGLIIISGENNQKEFSSAIKKISSKLKFPILFDGTSSQRINNNIPYSLNNFSSIVKSKQFSLLNDPEIIILIGKSPTSASVLDFLNYSKAYKISVSSHVDKVDPSGNFDTALTINETDFCISALQKIKIKKISLYTKNILQLDSEIEIVKKEFLKNINFGFEGKVVVDVIKYIPEKSNLFISSSMPIRDLDFFASNIEKQINLYCNRGASGIDGIISSALGIASQSLNNFLITGDLAYFYDISSLQSAIKYNIPITVILINNNGGGIFESLPISKYRKFFDDYFITPHNLNLGKITKSFGCNYFKINTTRELKRRLSLKQSGFTLLEIKTNAFESKQIRDEFRKNIISITDKFINEN